MAPYAEQVPLDRSGRSGIGHRTPLQAARTPFLDELASRGANGLYHAASLGVALPSENAHFVMFGYDLAEFPGRGALEAIGTGIPLGPKDVAILAHFVSVRMDDGVAVLEAIRPERTEEEASSAFEAIGAFRSDDVDFRLHRTCGVDGILTLCGDVSPFITDSDTMQTGRPLIAVKPWETRTGEPGGQERGDRVSGCRDGKGTPPASGRPRGAVDRDLGPLHPQFGAPNPLG